MSSQTANDFLMYALYCLPLVVILAIYLRRQRRVHKHSRRVHEETVSAGLTEPASLHPIIDESRCLGCGACVKACP
jgi:thioredoxin reductase (NADPH)